MQKLSLPLLFTVDVQVTFKNEGRTPGFFFSRGVLLYKKNHVGLRFKHVNQSLLSQFADCI